MAENLKQIEATLGSLAHTAETLYRDTFNMREATRYDSQQIRQQLEERQAELQNRLQKLRYGVRAGNRSGGWEGKAVVYGMVGLVAIICVGCGVLACLILSLENKQKAVAISRDD